MPSSPEHLKKLQQKIWNGTLPLEIRLAASDCLTYDDSEPYLIQFPRLSFLAFLLPRLHAFFKSSLIEPDAPATDAWLSFEEVPLKWHYPLGLLYDVFSGAEPVGLDGMVVLESPTVTTTTTTDDRLPWRLVVHYTDYPHDQLIQLDADGRTMLDAFINSVKEADFIRNGTARTVMSLSKDDSDSLWEAVQSHDLARFNIVNNKLLSPPGVTIRHIPLKIYLPTSADPTPVVSEPISEGEAPVAKAGHIRVVQSLVPLQTSSKQPQTLGSALNSILPTIFPSRRNPLLAQPVLHGVVIPMSAKLEELGRFASYCDGFLGVGVVMMS